MGWNNWLYAERLGQKKQAPKPMTNADRIRAMSDEELAEILIHYNADRDVFIADDMMSYFDWESAVNAELEWLKQPAVED